MSHYVYLGVIAGLLLIPNNAAASPVCDELAAQGVRAEFRIVEIAREYPGTVAALTACIATAAGQPEADRAGTFVACGTIACALIGVENCFEIGKEVLALTVQQNRITEHKAHYNCH